MQKTRLVKAFWGQRQIILTEPLLLDNSIIMLDHHFTIPSLQPILVFWAMFLLEGYHRIIIFCAWSPQYCSFLIPSPWVKQPDAINRKSILKVRFLPFIPEVSADVTLKNQDGGHNGHPKKKGRDPIMATLVPIFTISSGHLIFS